MAISDSIRQRLGLRISFSLALLMLVLVFLSAWYLISKQTTVLEQQLVDKGIMQAGVGAKALGYIIEKAIDNGVFTLEDVFDSNFVEIPGFEPPKYHSKIDWYLDNTILEIEDAFLVDPVVLYAVLSDRKGYVPTHNTRYQQPISGDTNKDLMGNRTKRIFNDPVGLQASQNQKDFLRQIYYRDTGEVLWDISSPVYVKGRHFGAFRIGYSINQIDVNVSLLRQSIASVMLILTVLLSIAIFILVNRSILELRRITDLASQMADGDLDVKIESTSVDEIGKLADVLERMRVSLQKTLERLKRNF